MKAFISGLGSKGEGTTNNNVVQIGSPTQPTSLAQYEPEPPLTSPTCIVHTSYPAVDSVPPKPSDAWTRFVCVSDTHAHEFPVPPGDVLLHGGDLTNTGERHGVQKTVDWLKGMPHQKKIIVAGNHDLTLHRPWYDNNFDRWHKIYEDPEPIFDLLKGQDAEDAGIVYLQDELYEFQVKEHGRKWSVWGSPWSPWFYDWAFNYQRGVEADNIVKAMPDVDILITHGPPHGILDVTTRGEAVGCEALRARLDNGDLCPRLHLFGHIHEARGAILQPAAVRRGAPAFGTAFINAAAWPMGERARRQRVEFGTGPFCPIVVDLLDRIELRGINTEDFN